MVNAPSACNAEPLRVHLLGAFCVERGTKQIHFPTRKVESLFAFLVLHPEPHSREKLAALLWGDSTDEQARHSLRTALTRIRAECGSDSLLADRESVQFNPAFQVWVDALQVSASDELIIENYPGDLLPDFYDEWILPVREHLRTIYLDALVQIAQAHRAKSKYANAIEIARKILTHDPANEKAHQHLIFCLAAIGDRIGALKQFDACEKNLRAELNVAPSRETVALCAQIQADLTGGQAREAWLTNLPAPLTSFVGRGNEIREIREIIEKARLVTLIGAGGCGKTRLAIQVGTELAAEHCFKHGVWWVDLSALRDLAYVAHAVATVFDLRESDNLPILSLLTNYLRAKNLLLILDNCEQVIDACAQIVGVLLPACPHLRVLATSRERVNASGEFVWYVPSLACPQTDLPIDQLRTYDAIQLFSERARAVQAHWSLVGHGATVTHICAQLDGIPLALELAATRLNALSVEQIDARLSDRFNLLAGKNRTALPRHQTLRATMDWSYDLLPDAECAIFRQFGVFVGGWKLEAAKQIISPGALDYLTAFADKSLVVVEQRDGATRYRFLETIRQYAREKLEIANELRETQARHLDYFLQLAEQATPYLPTGDPAWLNRLENDYDNIRAALDYAIATNLESAVRLALSLEWFWSWHDRVKEGYGWALRILPLTEVWGPSKLRARALYLAGSMASDFPDRKAASAYIQTSLEMATAVDDKHTIAWSLYSLAVLAMRVGEWDKMRNYAEQSVPIFQELGIMWGVNNIFYQLGYAAEAQGNFEAARAYYEQCLAGGRHMNNRVAISWSLDALGVLAHRQGDYASADKFYTESIEITRQVGHKGMLTPALAQLGHIAVHQGAYLRARALFEESLALARLREKTKGQINCLVGFGEIAEGTGKPKLAAQLFGAAEAAYESIGAKILAHFRIEYDISVQRLRAQLAPEIFESVWQAGRKMTLEQAIESALGNL